MPATHSCPTRQRPVPPSISDDIQQSNGLALAFLVTEANLAVDWGNGEDPSPHDRMQVILLKEVKDERLNPEIISPEQLPLLLQPFPDTLYHFSGAQLALAKSFKEAALISYNN